MHHDIVAASIHRGCVSLALGNVIPYSFVEIVGRIQAGLLSRTHLRTGGPWTYCHAAGEKRLGEWQYKKHIPVLTCDCSISNENGTATPLSFCEQAPRLLAKAAIE